MINDCPGCGARVEHFIIDDVWYWACPGCGAHDEEHT